MFVFLRCVRFFSRSPAAAEAPLLLPSSPSCPSSSSPASSSAQGFHDLVPPELISLFNEKELELLISGLPDIDLDDLQANTDYSNWRASDRNIEWFWNVLKEFTKEEKANFLQFVSGTSKVPIGGFAQLQGMRGVQKFNIHRAYGGEGLLPAAHTCFNQLDLPEYKSEEETREKLKLALKEGSGGFGFG